MAGKTNNTLRHHLDSVKDGKRRFENAFQGGSSKEMAFVLVGEPGNGKTFFVEFLCNKYREFLAREENRKYSFRFVRARAKITSHFWRLYLGQIWSIRNRKTAGLAPLIRGFCG